MRPRDFDGADVGHAGAIGPAPWSVLVCVELLGRLPRFMLPLRILVEETVLEAIASTPDTALTSVFTVMA
jgi:hypothetical protein